MELSVLKDKIVKKENINLPLVFVASDNDFLISTYLKAIGENLSLNVKEVGSLAELSDIVSSVFFEDSDLFVLRVDKDTILNTIELPSQKIIFISSSILGKSDVDYVVFPKLENWMIEDYAKTKASGLLPQEVLWLCKICKYNIERLDLELDKLAIFEKNKQEKLFEEMNSENAFQDLNDLTIFNLSNVILKKDIVSIKKIMKDIDYLDIDGFGLISILITQFLKIINIQMNKNATAQSLNMTEKQFRAIQYSCYKYTGQELIRNYKFLNTIDSKLKSGKLDISRKNLIQYVLNNLLT